jgi:hypothetical protein
MLLFALLAIRQRIDVTLPCRPTAFHGKTPRSDVARHVLLHARRNLLLLRRVINVSLQDKNWFASDPQPHHKEECAWLEFSGVIGLCACGLVSA